MPSPPEPVSPDAPPLRGPVLMNQDWCDLTYLHWAVDPDRVTPLMPPGVRADVHDGATYVGLVPFRMVDAGLGRRSSAPWLGTFLETNVRLYSVDEQGRRGVVFLSLDADRLAVVLAARLAFAVPYRWSAMSYSAEPDPADPGPTGHTVHTYRSRLRWPGVRSSSVLQVRVGAARTSTPLDDFLSARWRLHTRHLGLDLHVPNEHGRWQIHDTEVLRLDDDGLLAAAGFADLAFRAPDHTGWSPGVHTRFGLPRRT